MASTSLVSNQWLLIDRSALQIGNLEVRQLHDKHRQVSESFGRATSQLDCSGKDATDFELRQTESWLNDRSLIVEPYFSSPDYFIYGLNRLKVVEIVGFESNRLMVGHRRSGRA